MNSLLSYFMCGLILCPFSKITLIFFLEPSTCLAIGSVPYNDACTSSCEVYLEFN